MSVFEFKCGSKVDTFVFIFVDFFSFRFHPYSAISDTIRIRLYKTVNYHYN
jgi:hypothetical protein